MAALPESLDLADSAGAAPSTATVQPTDFGLDAAGQAAERLEVGQRRNSRLQAQVDQMQAKKQAQPVFQQYESANSDAYAADAAAYTGAPGFAADQIAQSKERGQRVLGGGDAQALSPQAQSELSNMIDQHVAQVGQTAIAHEATVRAQPIAEQRQAQQTTQLSNGLSSYYAALAPLTAQQKLNYDPSQGGWAQQSLDAHDAAASAALSTAPPAIAPMLQEKLAQQRVEIAANASAQEAGLHDAYVVTNADKNISAGVNAVMTDPTQYDSVAANVIPTAVAALPVAVRPKATQQAMDQLVTARVKGLIDHGMADQAVAELGGPDGKAGRFDATLEPQAKETLLSEALAAARSPQVNSTQQATAQADIQRRAAGALVGIATTGQAPADAASISEMTQAFGFDKAAQYQEQQNQLRTQHQVTGDIHAMSQPDLNVLAHTAPPDPTSPTYSRDIQTYEVTQKAVQAEQATRAQGLGAWLWSQQAPSGQKNGKGPNGQPASFQATGADLQSSYQAIATAPSAPLQAQAGRAYAGKMMAAQAAAGADPRTWQMVPAQEAQRLAATVTTAPPEQRAQALASVAAIVNALPASAQSSTGQMVSPRNLLIAQLQQGKLSPTDAAALADFGDNAGALSRWALASSDPRAAKPMDKASEQGLSAAVSSQLQPWLSAMGGLPGQGAMAQARIDRTMQTARYLMLTNGQGARQAAESAISDMSDGEVLVRGQRMPAAIANANSGSGNLWASMTGQAGPVFRSGASAVLGGQAKVLSDLLANNGARLYAPGATPGTPDIQRRAFALQLQNGAKWVTSADGQSSTLMTTVPQGGAQPVLDRYGKIVSLPWSSLTSQATPGAPPAFGDPSPGVPRTAAGQPVAAMSTGTALKYFEQAIKGQEGGGAGVISPAGAYGVMQVMPETAKPYAARIFGQPLDLNRLLNDNVYNTTIGNAIATDALGQNSNHPVLAAVQYNAGRGALTGYVDKRSGQHVPGWLNSIGDPRNGSISAPDFTAKIPFKETRGYVSGVATRFAALMHAGQ